MLVPRVPATLQLRSQANTSVKIRRSHPRSKTNCLACRQQRKCDERQPSCVACERQGLNCTWPAAKGPASVIPSPPKGRDAAPKGGTKTAAVSRAPARQNTSADLDPSLQGRHPTTKSGPESTAILRAPSRQLSSLDPLRPLCLTPESTSLLQFYLWVTTWQLAAVSPSYNPFITSVLPAAKANDTLMHAVLAVSGAHLAYNASNPGPMEIATRQHYSCAIKGVRDAIAKQFLDTSGFRQLSLVLAFLCRHEILSDAPQATVSMHLHAMRQIFSKLSTQGHVLSETINDIDQLLGLAYEEYSFYLPCNSTIPSIAPNEEPHGVPDEVQGESRFAALERSSGAETVFAGSYELFGLIPQIQRLCTSRLAEEAAGQATPSQHLRDSFHDLESRIDACERYSKSPPGSDESGSTTEATPSTGQNEAIWRKTQSPSNNDIRQLESTQESLAIQCVRHALHVYALTSLEGSLAGLTNSSRHSQGLIRVNAEAAIEIALSRHHSLHSQTHVANTRCRIMHD